MPSFNEYTEAGLYWDRHVAFTQLPNWYRLENDTRETVTRIYAEMKEEIDQLQFEVSESSYDTGYEEGEDIGYRRGYDDGQADGLDTARAPGYDEGYEAGFAAGSEQEG